MAEQSRKVAKVSKTTIGWEEYFMGIAKLASFRSKDPVRQVVACIVSPDNKVIGVGYNGHPKVRDGSDNDKGFPWTKFLHEENKHMYVCHAELNAIVQSTSSVKDATMYVTSHPCNECAKLIVQSELKKVVYLENKESRDNALDAANKIFQESKIGVKKFNQCLDNHVQGIHIDLCLCDSQPTEENEDLK